MIPKQIFYFKSTFEIFMGNKLNTSSEVLASGNFKYFDNSNPLDADVSIRLSNEALALAPSGKKR